MAIFTRRNKDNYYEHLIESVVFQMNSTEELTEEYATLLARLEKLERLNKEVNEPLLDANKTLLVAGNIVGILAVLHYEQVHVVASKALPLIMKLK